MSRKISPIAERLHADLSYVGRGVTVAFLDSGFYGHPDLTTPRDRTSPTTTSTRPRAAARRWPSPRPRRGMD